MSGLEGALLAVGRAVVTRVVAAWQGDRAARRERSADLVDLLEPRFPDLFGRRRLARQFETVADDVAARLDRAFGPDRLPENEKLAALAEVTDTLAGADLSDAALFAADVDPAVLARRLRDGAAGRVRVAGLGEAATAFFYRVLDDCAGCLVGLVLRLPAFEPRAAAETLARLSGLAGQLTEVLERLPRTSLDAPAGTGRDAEFERRYLAVIGEELDRLELFGVSTRRYRPAQRLTVAYLSLSVSDDAEPRHRRGRPETLLRGRPFLLPDDTEPVPRGGMRVEAALGRAERVFLRGEAGSGKTTLLHWLAVTAARRGFTGELSAWNGPVPFLVTLRRYAGADLPR
ncbi:MAG TPA: NACHT domain-containing protein, partial [Mycobacteriales bacterium]|nr:NACHT domain-containing protein [Mycobacteriales bacterium]